MARWYTINWMVEFLWVLFLHLYFPFMFIEDWNSLDGSTQYDWILLSCNAYGWMPTNPDWGLHLVFYTECNPQTFERVFLCILQFARETCWPLVFLSDFLVCGKIRLEVNKLCWAVWKKYVNPWDRPFWALFPKLSLNLIVCPLWTMKDWTTGTALQFLL